MLALTPLFYSAIFLGAISSHEGKVFNVSTTGKHTLEYLLCDQKRHKAIGNNAEIKFTSSSDYTLKLSQERVCLIEDITNLTLSGGSGEKEFSNITCVSVGPTRYMLGFGFVNVSNLTINNLHIKNCASSMLVNSTKIHLTHQVNLSNNATTLLLYNCYHVKIQHTKISAHDSSFLVMEEVLGEVHIEDFNVAWVCKGDNCRKSVNLANEPVGVVDIPSTNVQFPQVLKSSASAVIVVTVSTSADLSFALLNCKLSLHCCNSPHRPKFGYMYLNVSAPINTTAIKFSTVKFVSMTIFASLHFTTAMMHNSVFEPFQLQHFTSSLKMKPFKPQWNVIVRSSETQAIQINIDCAKLENSPMLVYSKSRNSNTSVNITKIRTAGTFQNAHSTLCLVFECYTESWI